MLPVEDDLRYLASRLLLFIVQFLAGSPIQAHLLAVCVQNPGSVIQDTLSCDGSILRYVFFFFAIINFLSRVVMYLHLLFIRDFKLNQRYGQGKTKSETSLSRSYFIF